MRKLQITEGETERWTANDNSAVSELLDHIARELAEEYVRLMRNTHQVSQPMEEEGKK